MKDERSRPVTLKKCSFLCDDMHRQFCLNYTIYCDDLGKLSSRYDFLKLKLYFPLKIVTHRGQQLTVEKRFCAFFLTLLDYKFYRKMSLLFVVITVIENH